MESQNSEEFQNSETEEFGKPIEEIEKLKVLSIIKKIFAKKNLTTIALIGALTVTGVGLGFSLCKYFPLKKIYDNLKQEYSQSAEENSQLKQEQEQLKQEHAGTLEKLTQEYNIELQEKEQLKQQNQELTNKNKQAKQQYEQLNQQFTELNEKSSQIGKEHNKTLQEAEILSNAVHTLTKENKKLKQQLEEKITSELEIIVEPYKELSYSSGYGFPDYTEGLLNLQHNWQSSDILENKGWQVISKRALEKALQLTENNVLCFKPSSDFNDFSSEDNYATFHLQTNTCIEDFIIGGEYYIQKNGWLDIFVSGDNQNWIFFQHFDSRGKEDYRVACGHTPYYSSHWKKWGLKLDKDLYVRYSAGADSNKNYFTEIWNVSFHIGTE